MRTTQIKADKLKLVAMLFGVAMLFSGSALSASAAVQDLSDTSVPLDIPLVMGYADGNEVFYIATDASAPEVAEMLGVIHVEKTGKTLVSSAASDLYVFANGITGSGPAGFQASIGSTQEGDEFYSPFWRIQMTTWADAEAAPFLTTA